MNQQMKAMTIYIYNFHLPQDPTILVNFINYPQCSFISCPSNGDTCLQILFKY